MAVDDKIVDRPAQAVTSEIADIDRDREITVALIEAASAWAGVDAEPHKEEELKEIEAAARSFLLAWFKRKTPGLELPKF